jgi:hypothetical protein
VPLGLPMHRHVREDAGGSGWRWFHLVALVFVVGWSLDLILGLIGRSGSSVLVAAINLLIWVPLMLWAKERRDGTKKLAGVRWDIPTGAKVVVASLIPVIAIGAFAAVKVKNAETQKHIDLTAAHLCQEVFEGEASLHDGQLPTIASLDQVHEDADGDALRGSYTALSAFAFEWFFNASDAAQETDSAKLAEEKAGAGQAAVSVASACTRKVPSSALGKVGYQGPS